MVEQPDEGEEGAQNGQEEKAVKRKRTVEDEVCLPQICLRPSRSIAQGKGFGRRWWFGRVVP